MKASKTQLELFPTEETDQHALMDKHKGKKLTPNQVKIVTDAVVKHYQSFHPQARPGDKERRKIHTRLKEGYSGNDLCSAISGCHKTPYNLGANPNGTKYLALELIMRTSSHVARFIENNAAPPKPRNERERRTLEEFTEWITGTESALPPPCSP